LQRFHDAATLAAALDREPGLEPVFNLGGTPTSGSADILLGDVSNGNATPPTWTAPAGFIQTSTKLVTEGNNTRVHRPVVYVGQSAASVTGTLSASAPWAAIGIEILW